MFSKNGPFDFERESAPGELFFALLDDPIKPLDYLCYPPSRGKFAVGGQIRCTENTTRHRFGVRREPLQSARDATLQWCKHCNCTNAALPSVLCVQGASAAVSLELLHCNART